MEIKLGSIPVRVGPAEGFILEVFHEAYGDPGGDIAHLGLIHLVLRHEHDARGNAAMIVTPSVARALAALLTIPIQTP